MPFPKRFLSANFTSNPPVMKTRLLGVLLTLCLPAYSQHFSPRYESIKLKEVNSTYHDAAPVISPDGKKLYIFVADHPSNTFGKTGTQDIWLSTKDDKGAWSAPKHAGSPLNQSKINQVYQVLPDGSLLVRGGRGKNEKGISLVSASGSFRELKVPDFETMVKGQFNGATISSDAKHLIMYFSEVVKSIRSDLYISHEQNGTWSRPVKLKISSGSDEFAPFISPDDKTLYFA